MWCFAVNGKVLSTACPLRPPDPAPSASAPWRRKSGYAPCHGLLSHRGTIVWRGNGGAGGRAGRRLCFIDRSCAPSALANVSGLNSRCGAHRARAARPRDVLDVVGLANRAQSRRAYFPV